MLEALIRSAPDLSAARQLLVTSLAGTREFPAAIRELNAWLMLEPGSLDARVLLARCLLESGRPVDAAVALRIAFDAAPADPAVQAALAQLVALVRTLLTFGRLQEALGVVAPLADSAQASGSILMLHGHALMASGRKDEAETVMRRWVQREPDERQAVLRLAAVLADNGKPEEAEGLIRAEVRRYGDSSDAAFVLGRALLGLSRFDEAETEFRKVVHAHPEHQIAHSNLMELVWMRTGDVHSASRAIDKALRAQPELRGLRITKARLLESAQLPREALAELEAGLATAATDAALLSAATTVALDFDGDRAMHYAERLVALVPADRQAQVALGNAALATGKAELALQVADSLHRTDPNDGRALAMRGDALRMLGESRWRELHDLDQFVRADLIDVPEGWGSLAEYIAQLVDELKRSHVLHAHPIGNSLRGGSQVHLQPAASPFAAIRAFPQAIDGAIRRYMRAIGQGADAMRVRNTGRYQLSGIWSVRLRPHGFHANHYHPEGWMSSACYLELPQAVRQGTGEGWLKFGEPAFPTRPQLTPEYFIKPEPGLLALFPSYMWHGTVPFGGSPDESRLTVAFDVVPA